MHDEVAVWDGRFQPLHKGHIEVVQAILDQFDTRLAVMIIQSSAGAGTEYQKVVNEHHRLSRNPLSFWERYQMMELALGACGLADRVNIIGIPRPDLYWEIARNFYPDKRFICLTGKDDYEKRKEAFWASLGETTRTIDASALTKISASRFKNALKSGKAWRKYLPAATLDYFGAIDGPARFIAADL